MLDRSMKEETLTRMSMVKRIVTHPSLVDMPLERHELDVYFKSFLDD